MHKKLVPDGRTHRLSVLVASMLVYASSIAWSSRDEGDGCGVDRTHHYCGGALISVSRPARLTLSVAVVAYSS